MRIENRTLILEDSDIGHICSHINGTTSLSKLFYRGLIFELEMNGLTNEDYDTIVLELNKR